MNRTIYEEYAIIDQELKMLEERKEKLRGAILADMGAQDLDKHETPLGKFSVSKLKKWTYPEHVTALGEQFKAEKAKAESTGEATYTEQDSLRFTAINI